MNDTEKLAVIQHIMDVNESHLNADDGDKYLSQSEYAMEAISAVLGDYQTGMLRQFMEAEVIS